MFKSIPLKKTIKVTFYYVTLIVLITLPIVLFILPADFFDKGQNISLFALLGYEDFYSQGMTKACMHLIHFNFEQAYAYNRIAFIAFPILMYLWIQAYHLKLYQIAKYHDHNTPTFILFLIKKTTFLKRKKMNILLHQI